MKILRHMRIFSLYGEKFLDAFMTEANLLQGKILSNSHLGSYTRLEIYSHKKLLVFFGLTFSMRLIIVRSMKAF